MKTTIIIITSEYLHPFVQDVIEHAQLDCDMHIVEYNNFYHITEIYKKYESIADGFMISGNAALAAIEKTLPTHKKPIIAFQASIISVYHLLLEKFLENRKLDTKRVFFDFLLLLYDNTDYATVDYFLYHKVAPQIKTEIDDWLNAITLSEISLVEEKLSEKIIDLWSTHKMDLVICHYGSIIPLLKQHNIPYCYSPPKKEDLLNLINTFLSQIELNRLRENLPGVIAVTLLGKDKRPMTKISLKKHFQI